MVLKCWSTYKQLCLNQLRQMHYGQILIQKVRVCFFADFKGKIIINFGFICTSKNCATEFFYWGLHSFFIHHHGNFHLLLFPVSLFYNIIFLLWVPVFHTTAINEQWISQKPQNFFKPQKHEIKNVNLPSEMNDE